MAIKVLKDAGFTKEDHILTLIHRGADTLGEVRVKDENDQFVTFTSPLPIATALDVIRCNHNADVMNGKITTVRTMPKTPETQAALARLYMVGHLI
jgi:hypothetical protein